MSKSNLQFLILGLGIGALIGVFMTQLRYRESAQQAHSNNGQAKKKYRIGVSVLNARHPYYISLIEGYKKHAKAAGVEVLIRDPNFKADEQTKQIKDLITQNVDAIIMAPCQPGAMSPLLSRCQKAGIPLIAEGSNISPEGKDQLCLIQTNNYQGGLLAGRFAGQQLKARQVAKPKVLVIDLPTFPSCVQRSDGFLDGLKEIYPIIDLVGRPDAKGRTEIALKVSRDMLQREPHIDVGFGINDNSALGLLRALQIVKNEKAVVVGFDADFDARVKIRSDPQFRGSIAQLTDEISKQAILAAVAAIEKKPLEKVIQVTPVLITKQNVDKFFPTDKKD